MSAHVSTYIWKVNRMRINSNLSITRNIVDAPHAAHGCVTGASWVHYGRRRRRRAAGGGRGYGPCVSELVPLDFQSLLHFGSVDPTCLRQTFGARMSSGLHMSAYFERKNETSRRSMMRGYEALSDLCLRLYKNNKFVLWFVKQTYTADSIMPAIT